MQADDELALGSEPDAAARARRFLRGVLRGLPDELLDDAVLVVTELVTNAQLHGEPPIRVRARGERLPVRVEVRDAGPRAPVLPAQSAEAMTGRGLALVGAVSTGWGVDAVTGGGKTVWAELGGAADGAAPVQLAGLERAASSGEVRYPVRLGAVPTDLLLDAKRHIDNVVRELTLERAGLTGASAPGLVELVDVVTTTFAEARDGLKRQALEAVQRGADETDLVLELPGSAADAGERYLRALEEADAWSRAARLLTLETPPLHRVFRRWYVTSLVAQLRARAAGEEPPPSRSFVGVLSREVAELSALRETADRLSLLQQVNRDLTHARTTGDIAGVVTGHLTRSLGAIAVRVFLVQGDVLRAVHVHGGDQRWVRKYEQVPLAADLPGPVVFRTGEALLLRTAAQAVERFPVLAEVYDTERALLVVPLVVGDHRLGVLAMSFLPGGERDEETQTRFVRALADALAQALERSLALQELATAAERLAFVADASVALTASLDLDQTVAAVTGLLVPRLADWCSVQIEVGGQLATVALAHSDPDKVRWAREVDRRYPAPRDAPTGAPNVLRTGVSELYAAISDEQLAASAVDPEHLALLRSVGMRSALAVPLPGRHRILGVLTVIYAESGRRYTAADVAHVEDVARRAALALEAATVLRDVQRVAEAAQRAILAEPPARVGPVSLAARYSSAAADALVGGDLYEVVARDGAVRLLVGDVRGKGLSAVRTATVVLGDFRAGAADLDDLGEVARQLDRRLRPYLEEEDFVTALLAEVRDDGTLVLASCGHPPALLARGGSVVELGTAASLPLGLGADPVLRTTRLEPGDRLLLYTDGVLEARDRDRAFLDLLELVGPLDDAALPDVLDGLLERLHARVGPDLGDDLALLVAQYVGRDASTQVD